jgi:hypothetical protein
LEVGRDENASDGVHVEFNEHFTCHAPMTLRSDGYHRKDFDRRASLAPRTRSLRGAQADGDPRGVSPSTLPVEVEDDGPGSSTVAAPTFDEFFSTKPDGTGLGLAIVHRIVTITAARLTSRVDRVGPPFGWCYR